MGERGTRQTNVSKDVGVERVLQLVIRQVSELGLTTLVSGVRHQDIESTVMPDDFVYQVAAKVSLRQVAGDELAGDAMGLHLPFSRLGVGLLLGKIVEGQRSALAGKEGG